MKKTASHNEHAVRMALSCHSIEIHINNNFWLEKAYVFVFHINQRRQRWPQSQNSNFINFERFFFSFKN